MHRGSSRPKNRGGEGQRTYEYPREREFPKNLDFVQRHLIRRAVRRRCRRYSPFLIPGGSRPKNRGGGGPMSVCVGDPVRAARRRKEAAGGHQEQALRHKIRQAKQRRTKKVEGKQVRTQDHTFTDRAGCGRSRRKIACYRLARSTTLTHLIDRAVCGRQWRKKTSTPSPPEWRPSRGHLRGTWVAHPR